MLKTSPEAAPSGMGVNSFAFEDTSPSLGQGEFDDEDQEALPLPLTPEMAVYVSFVTQSRTAHC